MTTLVNEDALDLFLDSATLDEARRAEAALTAMAASVHVKVVELETTRPALDFAPTPLPRRVS